MASEPYDPPVGPRGRPSSIVRAKVVTLNADSTVDVRDENSRTTFPRLRAPRGYTLAHGDSVLVGHVLGDRQSPVILTVEGP